jgi:hypothetical protein
MAAHGIVGDIATVGIRASSHWLRVMAVAFPALVVVSSPAPARPPAACARDIATYCSNVPHETSERVICLQAHASQLTAECREALKQKQSTGDSRRSKSKKAVQPWVSPCMNDIRALCQGIPAGPGRVAECLTQHQAQLSEPCKAAFTAKPD